MKNLVPAFLPGSAGPTKEQPTCLTGGQTLHGLKWALHLHLVVWPGGRVTGESHTTAHVSAKPRESWGRGLGEEHGLSKSSSFNRQCSCSLPEQEWRGAPEPGNMPGSFSCPQRTEQPVVVLNGATGKVVFLRREVTINEYKSNIFNPTKYFYTRVD